MAIRLKTKLPGPQSIRLMAERQKQVARGPFHSAPIFIERAKCALIEDVDGNQLIDFASGIGVNNVGHASAEVVAAIQNQAGKFLHAGFNVTPYEIYIRLCEKLNEAFPGNPSFERKSFLANSGAEAVENAIKIARAFTKRQSVICFDHAFHGRTYMAMTLTSKYKPYKYGFAPFNPEVYRAQFPYCYRWQNTSDPEKVSEECFSSFEDLLSSQLSPTQIAAVIIEPVLGEGGFIPAPPQFLAKLREFCTTHGIVLIADEIQSGFGRTGTLFASEQLKFTPDLLITAKGLGGGMPISAVTGRADIMDAPIEGGIGGTFGGNPVCCAAALAVFEKFQKEETLAHVKKLALQLSARLAQWKERYPLIGDVRGLGLMQGLEFVKSRSTKQAYPEAAKALTKYAYEHGVIIMTAGTYSNVVRFLMPLVTELDLLEEGLNVLESGLKSLK
ncbi:MAG: aspartate aminotransferase family protein [Bacteriovoracaceae bacterium]|nr:aspartate aminotransferase family protein [Bacteriovoracaceae bacterium]